MKYYACTHCDQVVMTLIDLDKPLFCCGEEMDELVDNTDLESIEMHKPYIRKIGNFVTVTIGDNHPMIENHHISFIIIETNQGYIYKNITGKTEAKADFILANHENILKVTSYCNIHELCPSYFSNEK